MSNPRPPSTTSQSSCKKSICVSLSEDTLRRLRMHSIRLNLSQSQVVENALKVLLDVYESTQKETINELECPTCGKNPRTSRCPIKCDENH